MLRNSIKFLSLDAWCQCACKLQNRRHVPFVETPLRLGKCFSACSLLPLCKEEIQNLSLAGMWFLCGEKPPLLLLIRVSRLHLSAAEWSLPSPHIRASSSWVQPTRGLPPAVGGHGWLQGQGAQAVSWGCHPHSTSPATSLWQSLGVKLCGSFS